LKDTTNVDLKEPGTEHVEHIDADQRQVALVMFNILNRNWIPHQYRAAFPQLIPEHYLEEIMRESGEEVPQMAEIPETLLEIEYPQQPTFTDEGVAGPMSLAQAKAQEKRPQHPKNILPLPQRNQCPCGVYFEDKEKLILHQILYCTNEWAKEQCTAYLVLEDSREVANFYQRCRYHINSYAEEAIDKSRKRAQQVKDRTTEQLKKANQKFFETLNERTKDPDLTAQIQTRMVRRAQFQKRQDSCVPYELLPIERRK